MDHFDPLATQPEPDLPMVAADIPHLARAQRRPTERP